MNAANIYEKYKNFPEELKKLRQFVCWVGQDKIPRNPHTGGYAKADNSDTWGTFDEAVKACEKYGFEGVGFEFAPPYFGVDLDHCIDQVDFCDEFVETLQSYTELSKSGNGIHIICKGTLPDGCRRRGGVEMYQTGRYFVCTGNVYNPNYLEINECTESIKILHNKYLPSNTAKTEVSKPVTNIVTTMDDDEIIEKARNCKSGALFQLLYAGEWDGLYPSQSEADLVFCNQLAFWTGCNRDQMDRIFRKSGLMRDKWDNMRGSHTYGHMTISKACASCTDVYSADKYGDDASLAISFFNGGANVNGGGAKNYDMTDTGNAHRLHDKYGKVVKYSYNRKKWYIWTGKQWIIDDMGEIKKLADEICEDIKKEALVSKDKGVQEKLMKFAKSTASSAKKEAMIKECQHLEDIPASPDDFDANIDYLNCQNGVVNLRNGELMPHDPNLMMSKICNTEYDTSHKTPTMWLKFLSDVTNGSQEMIDYIQKCIGYSISGSNSEQCAYFLYGMGNNGKSTFLDTIADIMGTYSSNTQPDTLMVQSRLGSSGGGANSDIARLKSARFVTCEEPTEGVRLNEGLLKQLTGGSKVTCRFLYGDEFEYTPEFKIWVATNHKPTIRGTDFGIWRRIKLIPFEVNIPKEKVDKNLKYKLRQEFPQILAWAVEGCIKWQREGLQEPQVVVDATNEYKNEMDLVASFVEQCMIIDYNSEVKLVASDIFSVYIKWAKQNNEYEMSSKKFFTELQKKLPNKSRSAKGIVYGNVLFTDYGRQFVTRQYNPADFR